MADVADDNTLRTIPGSDLVCVPNLVVVGPAFFTKKVNLDRQTDKYYLFNYTERNLEETKHP